MRQQAASINTQHGFVARLGPTGRPSANLKYDDSGHVTCGMLQHATTHIVMTTLCSTRIPGYHPDGHSLENGTRKGAGVLEQLGV
eukprot:12000255-Alexandrium_andersonii.AAC.1